MPRRVRVVDPPPQSSTRRVVVASLAGVGAALLGAKAALTFGTAPYDALAPLAGSFVALLAGAALAGGIAALQAPGLARLLLAVTLGGALIGDFLLPAAPHLLYLLPLAIATGLMFVAPPVREAAGHGRPARADLLGWLGVVLHAAVGLLYLMSGLVVPVYGVLFLWVLWAGMLVVVLGLLRNRPTRTPVVPVVAIGLWFAILHLGSAFLGWTA